MADFQFRLNPRAVDLPHCSAVLNGRGTTYQVDGYRTTLSVKSVTQGAARYQTPQGNYLVTADSFLILNHGQRYSLEFEGRSPTETLCPFLQPGLAEQASASLAMTTGRQLDDLDRAAPTIDYCERLYPKNGPVGQALRDLAAGMHAPHLSTPWLEDRMFGLAQALVQLHQQVQVEAESFPGLRPATRLELYRRLYRARDYLISCYAEPLTISRVARVATLSPFHFQRSFKLAFGRTPMQFLQETRLEAARRLLAETADGITEICLAVGFESLGSFSWLFRKRFGVSPRAYREKSENSRIQEVITGAVA